MSLISQTTELITKLRNCQELHKTDFVQLQSLIQRQLSGNSNRRGEGCSFNRALDVLDSSDGDAYRFDCKEIQVNREGLYFKGYSHKTKTDETLHLTDVDSLVAWKIPLASNPIVQFCKSLGIFGNYYVEEQIAALDPKSLTDLFSKVDGYWIVQIIANACPRHIGYRLKLCLPFFDVVRKALEGVENTSTYMKALNTAVDYTNKECNAGRVYGCAQAAEQLLMSKGGRSVSDSAQVHLSKSAIVFLTMDWKDKPRCNVGEALRRCAAITHINKHKTVVGCDRNSDEYKAILAEYGRKMEAEIITPTMLEMVQHKAKKLGYTISV